MYSTLLLFFVVVVWHLSSDFILLFIEILTFKQTPHTSHSFKDDEKREVKVMFEYLLFPPVPLKFFNQSNRVSLGSHGESGCFDSFVPERT